MAVGSGTPYNTHTGTGVATLFAYTFTLLDAADLVVTVDGVETTAYTVSGIGNPSGGSVTFSVAPANGSDVILRRVIDLVRATDYQNNGDLLAPTLNDDFDRPWMAIQQLAADGARAVQAPFPESIGLLPSAADRASRVLAFDSSGDPIAIAGVDSGSAAALALDIADSTSAGKGPALMGYDPRLIYTGKTIALALYGRIPATYFMSADQVADVLSNTGSMDVSTPLNQAIATGLEVDFPPGVYGVKFPLLPRTQQTLSGRKRARAIIRALSGFAGSAVVSYPSGTYSGITIQNLQIDANNIAARCLELIGSSQGAVDQVILRDLALSQPTARPIHFKNVTYWDWDRVITNGGTDGAWLEDCYSGDTRNCVGYHGARASLIIVGGASITLNGHKLFNNPGTNSTALLEIDGSHDIVAHRCEFEPQGAANVVTEVWIHDSSGPGNCTDNRLIDCNFVGVAGSKTRSLVIGGTTASGAVSGTNVYKTSVVRGRFIKPTGNESILLRDQTDTNLESCVDLITYDTGTKSPVTVLNSSGNVYALEGEVTGSMTVTLRGSTGDPTVTSGTITGTWTRQGRQVAFSFVTGAITWSAAGTGTLLLRLSGLDLTGGNNVPVSIGVCTLFGTAVSAAIVSSTDIALFAAGSGTALTWAAPPSSGGRVSISGTFTLSV